MINAKSFVKINKELSKSRKRKEKSELQRKISPNKDQIRKSSEAETLELANRLRSKERKR